VGLLVILGEGGGEGKKISTRSKNNLGKTEKVKRQARRTAGVLKTQQPLRKREQGEERIMGQPACPFVHAYRTSQDAIGVEKRGLGCELKCA